MNQYFERHPDQIPQFYRMGGPQYLGVSTGGNSSGTQGRNLNESGYESHGSRSNLNISTQMNSSYGSATSSKSGKHYKKTAVEMEKSIAHLIANAPQLCRDQTGCRLLQKKLEDERSKDFFNALFDSLLDSFPGLMKDPFGNYLC